MQENADAFLNSQEVPQSEEYARMSNSVVHEIFSLPAAEIPMKIAETLHVLDPNSKSDYYIWRDLSNALQDLLSMDYDNIDKSNLIKIIQEVRSQDKEFGEFIEGIALDSMNTLVIIPGNTDAVRLNQLLTPERYNYRTESNPELSFDVNGTYNNLSENERIVKYFTSGDVSFLTEEIARNRIGITINDGRLWQLTSREKKENQFQVPESTYNLPDPAFVDAVIEIFENFVTSDKEEIESFALESLANVFVYRIKEGEVFLKLLLSKLQFNNPDKYYVTAHLLDFLQQVLESAYWKADEDDWVEHSPRNDDGELEDNLKQIQKQFWAPFDALKKEMSKMASEKTPGLFLLKKRAQHLLSSFEQFENSDQSIGMRPVPQKLTDGFWGMNRDGKLYISDPQDFELLEGIITEASIIRCALSNGLSNDCLTKDVVESYVSEHYPDLYGKINRHVIEMEVRSYGTVPRVVVEAQKKYDSLLQATDVLINNSITKNPNGVFGEVSSRELLDYQAVINDSLLSDTESLFGEVSLSDLSFREQIYYLNYLKSTSNTSFNTMKDFLSHYGVDAMRSFLANSYDKNASGNIMVFGTMIEPEIANEMFGAYAQSIDSTHALTSSFQTYADNLSKTEGVPETVSTEAKESVALLRDIEEGMLKRAGHLFEAGKQMSLWEYRGEEQTLDLIEAYKGVAKMQDMLARVGSSEGMHITRNSDREGGKNPLHDIGAETFFFNIEDAENNEQLDFKVTIRPQANENGEARINFELYLDKLPEDSTLRQAFQQRTEFLGAPGKGRKRTVEKSVIRFGFDLDTNDNPPVFSFDMGRGEYNSENMRRTGDVLGKILSNVAPEGSHLTDFDESFSNPENFQKIATEFKRYFQNVPLANRENLVTESAREAA